MSNRDRWKDHIEFQQREQQRDQLARLRARRAAREPLPQISSPFPYFLTGLAVALLIALIAVWIFA